MSIQKSAFVLFTALGLTLGNVMTHSEMPAQARSERIKHKPLQDMSEQEINTFLRRLPRHNLVSRIETVSAQAANTPYLLGPLGEGEGAPYDAKPLMNLKKVDCVTFCEQTLALALSRNYGEALSTLQKIRYKAGEIKMECRNHYTMADWTVNNRWLMDDVTPKIPGHQWLTRTISHKKLFEMQKFEGIQVREPDRLLKVAYIPENHLLRVASRLKSGDIGVLIQNRDGIFAAHTGFMIRKGNQWVYRNATSIGPRKVVDTPFSVLVKSLKKSKRLIGMSFIRPKNSAFKTIQGHS